MSDPVYGPPSLGLSTLFLKFLRFGCLAFGGPVAQIAMIRQALVEQERWISPARFNRLLAVMQILPGPEAHELCVHLGITARGRWGGLLAGLGFMLPGLVLMLLAGWLYQGWIAGSANAAPILFGIQVVVLAIILRAVTRIGQHILAEDLLLWALAALTLLATLTGVPFWAPLLLAGATYALAHRPALATATALTGVALMIVLRSIDGPGAWLHPAASTMPVTTFALFVAGLKGGLLTFGGAYTAIPFVRADTVGRGWISDASFLDGVALANTLPAPLVIFATFAGYIAGGLSGALAITLGMFLPAFAFSMVLFERLEAIVEHPATHRFLAGVAAAVVGVIAATLLQLCWATWARASNGYAVIAIFVAGVAAVLTFKGKWLPLLLVVAAGIAGWLMRP
jgi:chromate transporter